MSRADPDHEGDDEEGTSRRTATWASGTIFTDHMFVADFQEEKGWYDPRVEPYGPLSLDPATAVLHYAQAHLRRAQGVPRRRRQDAALPAPEARRAAESHSAQRMCIPPARPRPGAPVHRGRPWSASTGIGCRPTVGTSLYVRPTDHRQRGVPRRAAGQVVPLLRDPLAGRAPTTRRGMAPVKIRVDGQVRAGGGRRPRRGQDRGQLRGEPVRGRGGQARGLHAGAVAGRRAPQVHRRGRHHEHHGADRRRGDHARPWAAPSCPASPATPRWRCCAAGACGCPSGRSRSTRSWPPPTSGHPR